MGAHCQHARIPRLQIAEVVLGDWDLSSDPDCKFDADTDECVDGPAPSSHRNAQRFEVTSADVTVHESWDLTKVVNNGRGLRSDCYARMLRLGQHHSSSRRYLYCFWL